MSVQTQIDRIDGNVKKALAKIAEKGVSVAADANSDDLEALIAAIEAGGGSGGGNYAFSHGSFTPSSDITSIVINHNLGVVPNIVVAMVRGSYSLREYSSAGCIAAMNFVKNYSKYNCPVYVYSSGSYSNTMYMGADITADRDAIEKNKSGVAAFSNADAQTIRFGGSPQATTLYYLRSGKPYDWFAFYIPVE